MYVEELKEYVPEYKYKVVELSRLDRDWLKEVEGILSRVLYFMGIERDRAEEELLEFVEVLRRSPYAERIERYLTSVLVAEGLKPSEAEGVVRFLATGEMEGMIRMLREARMEGAIEKAKEDILKILKLRFGGEQAEVVEGSIDEIEDLQGDLPKKLCNKFS